MDSCTRRFLPAMLAVADSTRVDSLGNRTAFPYAANRSEDDSDAYSEDEPEGKGIAKFVTKKSFHTVRRGETLVSISRKFDVEVREIKKWNHLRKSSLQRGQKLVVYKAVKQTIKNETRVADAIGDREVKAKSKHVKHRYHTVQHGDTLWTISQRYGLPLNHLKKTNKIRGNEIKPGQKLIITS